MKRRTVLISSSILVMMIALISFIFLFNNRINQIEQVPENTLISDPLLGFMVLDQVGLSTYDSNDETTLISLIDSGLYPYEYLRIDGSESAWVTNKSFDTFISENREEIELTTTVFIKRDTHMIVHLYQILYNLSTETMYLGAPLSYSGSNLMFTITQQFGDKKNEIVDKDTYYNITLAFVDELESVELYQYNEAHGYIDSQEIDVDSVVSLDSETLYFIIRETYRDIDGNLYINKIEVNYNEFDQFFGYQFKVFEDNNFGENIGIRIDTYL